MGHRRGRGDRHRPELPTTSSESSFLPSSYESIRAANLQDQAFPQTGHVTSAAAIIVFARADGGRLTAADSAKVAAIAETLGGRHIPDIVSVTAGPPSPNRLVQTALVAMPNSVVNGSGTTAGDAVKVLRADIKPLVAGTGLAEGVTGAAAQQLDSQQSSNRADQIVLLATLVLILVLLLVIFRSPVIALLPLIVIALVSQVATGLIADVNKALNLNADSSISTILIVVLFGIGTDYILFLMFRYRERLRGGEDAKQAMVSAVTRVGEVIASAAGVVIAAFLALLLSTLSVLRSMGPALAIAVAVTLVAGLTLIPAVVSLLGPRVFWPSKSWQREPRAARFAAIGRALGRRPGVFAAVSGLVLVALAIGAFGFKPTFDLSSAGIPASAESQTALGTLEKGLPPGATDPTDVLLHATSGRPLPAADLAAYGAKLKALPGVGAVAAPQLSADRATADYPVTLSHDPQSTAAVNVMKSTLVPGAHAAAPAGHVRAGRRHHGGIRRHPARGQPRLRGGVPGRGGHHLAHPGAAAAQRGGAVVPDGLGRPRVRRHPGRERAGVPGPARPGRAGVPAAGLHVPVRGRAGHRLQHLDDRAAARAGRRGQAAAAGRRDGPAARRAGDRRGRADPGRHVRLADPGRQHDPVPARLRRVLRNRAGRVRDGDVLRPQPDRADRAPRLVARPRGQAPRANDPRQSTASTATPGLPGTNNHRSLENKKKNNNAELNGAWTVHASSATGCPVVLLAER